MNEAIPIYRRPSPARWLILLLEGAVVGVGAILPGVSGGVLCVIFGLYQPMMQFLSHPVRMLKPLFWLLFPFMLGFFGGFVSLSGVIAALFEKESALVISLFVGLIAGMFPSLFREAARDGRTKGMWAALIASTALLLTFFFSLQSAAGVQLTPSVPWFFFCGVMWGVSLIVPGMSSSSLLIFLGLYQPMSAGIAGFDPAVLIPFLLGIVSTALLLARGVNALFARYYGIAFHCIIGFVIASTIPIIPTAFRSVGEAALCLLLAIAGCCASIYMDRWTERIKEKQPEGAAS